MARYAGKNTTGSFRKLDVRLMQRKGALRPGTYSTWHWSRGGEPSGSISTRAEFGYVVLSYRHQRWDETEWTHKEYRVSIEWTRCHFGGERAWFRCPASGCARRVAVLWGGEIYACRQCHNLAYESQNETRHGRMLIKTQAIRMKLGGSPSLLGDFPPKPKGMHWKTYWRLKEMADAAEDQSWPPWVYRMLEKQV